VSVRKGSRVGVEEGRKWKGKEKERGGRERSGKKSDK
jgi:hypothetical protein